MQKKFKTLMLTLLTVVSASLSAAPVGYSINSDSGSDDSDGLYRIDLATGEEIQRIGTIQSLLKTKIDVEGLAFAPNGTLYGIDDDTLTLFPINITNAVIASSSEVDITSLTPRDNDFGVTFACDENLYVSSVTKRSIYRMDLDGTATLIGAEGSLGANISALAAYGDPIRLYGLGNGTASGGFPASPNLYEIDILTGVATLIGPLGPGVGQYAEGGLSFDDDGQLWAITDRRTLLLPSQVMRINTTTGAASEIRNTSEEGFESLAIAVPGGCAPTGEGENAAFVVQKRFDDDNNIAGGACRNPSQSGEFRMSTFKQISANNENARKSTGARTAAGKTRASMNALTHGLTAEKVVIEGEVPEDFEAFRQDVYQHLEPVGFLEKQLVERVAVCLWRLRRIPGLESETFGFMGILGGAFESMVRPMTGLSRYEGGIERSLYRALHELERLQKERQDRQASEPVVEVPSEALAARRRTRSISGSRNE